MQFGRGNRRKWAAGGRGLGVWGEGVVLQLGLKGVGWDEYKFVSCYRTVRVLGNSCISLIVNILPRLK